MATDPEITQIENAIIAEVQRTEDRPNYPVIGIQDADHWSGGDIQEMLMTILSPQAVRVIYAGSKPGPLKVIGGGSTSDDVQNFKVALIVTDLTKGPAGSSAGYAAIEAIKKCLKHLSIPPLRGFLWVTSDDLLLVKNGKYIYGFDIERRYIAT